MTVNTLESIRARLSETTSGCLEWTGQRNTYGYGRVSWRGRGHMVHRIVYELTIGPIPEGLHLDHLCRNRACANPAHLEPVTNAENLRRSPLVRFNNGNALKTHCKHGHEFTPENTYITPQGKRTCRACNKASASRTQSVRLERARRDAMIDPAATA